MKKYLDKISTPGEHIVISVFKFCLFLLTPAGIRLLKTLIRKRSTTEKSPTELIINYDDWLQHEANKWSHISNSDYTFYSVIIIASNEETFLENINSITKDSVKYELLIADLGISNNSLKKTEEKLHTQNIKYKIITFHQENYSTCFNKLAELATGEILFFVGVNDVLLPFALTKINNSISSTRFDIAYTDYIKTYNHQLKGITLPGWSPHALYTNNYIGETLIVSKKYWDNVYQLSSELHWCYWHHWLLQQLRTKATIIHLPIFTHKKNRVNSIQNEYTTEAEQIIKKASTYIDAINVLTVSTMETILQPVYTLNNTDLVSIIIPTKDQSALLEQLLVSIYNCSTYRQFEVIVINNNSSTNEFYDLIKKYGTSFTNFKCIDAFFEFNFSKLINTGVANAAGKYILMLNNDMKVITNNWLEEMIGTTELPNIGAVGAKLFFEDDTIQHAGVILNSHNISEHIYINKYEHDIIDSRIYGYSNYNALTGAALLVKKDIFLEVGGMNESLPVEYNDIDFCLKLRSKGYYNVLNTNAQLYHYESATRGHPFKSLSSWKQHEHDEKVFLSYWESYLVNDEYTLSNPMIHFS